MRFNCSDFALSSDPWRRAPIWALGPVPPERLGMILVRSFSRASRPDMLEDRGGSTARGDNGARQDKCSISSCDLLYSDKSFICFSEFSADDGKGSSVKFDLSGLIFSRNDFGYLSTSTVLAVGFRSGEKKEKASSAKLIKSFCRR